VADDASTGRQGVRTAAAGRLIVKPAADTLEPGGRRPWPGTSQVRLLLRLLQPFRPAALAVVTLGALASLAEGLGLGLLMPFLQSMDPDSTSVQAPLPVLAGVFDDVPAESRLIVIAAAIFGCILLRSALVYVSTVLFNWLSVQVGHRLRSGIFDQVLTADLRLLHAEGAARLLNALHTESWRTTQAVSTLLGAVITCMTLLVYLTLLLLISWKLTLVVVLLLTVIAGLVRFLMRNVRTIGEATTEANADLARRMVDGVDGIEVIRSFGREDYERRRFDAVSERLNRLMVRLGTLSSAVYPVYEVLVAGVLLGVLLLSARGAADVAPLLVFVFVLYRLEPRVKELDRARVDLVALDAAVRDTLRLATPASRSGPVSGTRECGDLSQGIRLEQVSFRYGPGATPALRDVSLDIPAGSTTAIVGPSGAGKSTLIKLLVRFFDPTTGQILADGVPLPECELESWRRGIAVVGQKAFLFSASVLDNIGYGLPEANRDAVIRAARQAGAHDFITRLPEGYDTLLGEGGVQLSGGEEQRIALARAIVRRPRLLILDEATNALDTLSEALVQRALDELRRQCTIVVIAHRLSTVEKADQIAVLQEGMLVERGNLAELLRLDGLFARLYRLQAPLSP
jgi:subfamily B ATP-binding cassette protein MsbA